MDERNRSLIAHLAVVAVFSLPVVAPPEASAQALTWQLAVPKAISLDPKQDAWYSGRAEEALDFRDERVLVGTNSGGLWWALNIGRGGPLSDDWDDPDVTALERGPDSEFHVYAATTQQLRENRGSTLDQWQVITRPCGGVIRDVAVLQGARRIIVACTDGVFWSDTPMPDAPRLYNWREASGLGKPRDVWSLAVMSTAGGWSAPEATGAREVPEPGAIAVVSRDPVRRDVFWVAKDGTVRTAWHVRGGSWKTRAITTAGAASSTSPIAAVARGESHLDVFFAGPAGELKTTWWDAADGDWITHTYPVFGAGTVGRASIAVTARTTGSLDLFWVSPGAAVMRAMWSGNWSAPRPVTASNGANAATPISVVSRKPHLLDVFWVSPAGNVSTAAVTSTLVGMPAVQSIPSGSWAGSGLSAVSRSPDKLDVVWIAPSGQLMTSWWNEAAAKWTSYAVSAPGAALRSGSVSLVSRNPLQLDVFWQHTDGSIATNYWNARQATDFAAQSYVVTPAVVRTFASVSAFDDELTVCSVESGGGVSCNEWMQRDGIVIAGRSGDSTTPLMRGTFSPAGLTFANAKVSGSTGVFSSTSVAISKYTGTAFAVSASSDGRLKSVFRSGDAGATWTAVPSLADCDGGTLTACAGNQGIYHNNTIAVSPVDDTHLFLGWVPLFESTDGATSWRFVSSPHIHADIARVRFGDAPSTTSTVLVLTDGGVSVSLDAGKTFASGYNRYLASLQCYTTDGIRQTDGTLSASYQVNGLIAAGLQDNGNSWAMHGGAWQRITSEDGGYVTFVREPQLIARKTLNDSAFSRYEWNGHGFTDAGRIVVKAPPLSFDEWFVKGGFVIVNDPAPEVFRNVYGFAWENNAIYSLVPAGGLFTWIDWHFELETTAPLAAGEQFSAGGSADGRRSFFATSTGRIFSYDRTTGTLKSLPVAVKQAGYGINRLTVLSDALGFAILNCWRDVCDPNADGRVLRYDGIAWAQLKLEFADGTPLPSQRYYSIDADWTTIPQTIVLTSDDKVYRSTDLGRTWTDESTGLPRRAHLADVRFVVFPDGTKRFYLSTYGRSVWYADVK